MTETPAPDAAVQIAARAVLAGSTSSGAYGDVREVCDALARAGWLHEPSSSQQQTAKPCPTCGRPASTRPATTSAAGGRTAAGRVTDPTPHREVMA